MSAEDKRYERDLQAPALTDIARQQQVIRRLEEDLRRERAMLADLVCAATTSTPDSPIPYGRVEHVARLLGVKRDRITKIRSAVRKSRAGRTERRLAQDTTPQPPTLPTAARPVLRREPCS